MTLVTTLMYCRHSLAPLVHCNIPCSFPAPFLLKISPVRSTIRPSRLYPHKASSPRHPGAGTWFTHHLIQTACLHLPASLVYPLHLLFELIHFAL